MDYLSASDASGVIGAGGYYRGGYWALAWPKWMLQNPSVPALELYAIALHLRVFRLEFRGKTVQHRCDCQPAVYRLPITPFRFSIKSRILED